MSQRTMTWGDVAKSLSHATPDDLARPAEVYNPYFGRCYSLTSIDHLQSYLQGRQIPGDQLVLIVHDGK